MSFAKIIKSILHEFIDYRITMSYYRIIKRKIVLLRSLNQFKSFPKHKITPTISRYSFGHKYDKHFFDFYYSVSGKASADYIPSKVYYQNIEPILNDKRFANYLENKSLYDKNLTGIKTPDTILRKINGTYYTKDYQSLILSDDILQRMMDKHEKLIIKPAVESGGGKNIKIFEKKADGLFSNDIRLEKRFLDNYHDFIMQVFIIQHDFFSQFNLSSNNTIRLLIYRSYSDNQIYLLHSLLRIGKKGSYMDHDNLGGIVIGINSEGYLNDFGTDINGIRYTEFNDKKIHTSIPVPYFAKFKDFAFNIANQLYYIRLLAIDLTIDQKGDIYLLDLNCQGNGIAQYQMNSGPLFGPFTKEILDHCLSFKNHYTIKV